MKTLFERARVPKLVHKVPREDRTVCFYSDPNYNNEHSLIEEEFPFLKKDVRPPNRFMGDPSEFSTCSLILANQGLLQKKS